MGFHQTSSLLLLLSLIHAFSCQVSQVHGEEERKVYIVFMARKQHDDQDRVPALYIDMLTSVLGSKDAAQDSLLYIYKHAANGFAAMLTASQAKKIAGLPGVLGVQLDQTYHLDPPDSGTYLGMDYKHPTELPQKGFGWSKTRSGGVWPESRGSDVDGRGPIPSGWKSKCQTGHASNCNNG